MILAFYEAIWMWINCISNSADPETTSQIQVIIRTKVVKIQTDWLEKDFSPSPQIPKLQLYAGDKLKDNNDSVLVRCWVPRSHFGTLALILHVSRTVLEGWMNTTQVVFWCWRCKMLLKYNSQAGFFLFPLICHPSVYKQWCKYLKMCCSYKLFLSVLL